MDDVLKLKMRIEVRLKLAEMLDSQEDDYARFKMIRDFMGELSLSDEENKLVGLKVEPIKGGGCYTKWEHPEKDPVKEFKISDTMKEIICNMLKNIKINKNNVDLYEAFKPVIDKMNNPGGK